MNVIGFDDGPFARQHRGDVLLVGVVCSRTRVDGIVSGRVRRDGANSTRAMMKAALFSDVPRMRPRVRGALRKWRLINIPEPLRIAHLVAGGITEGTSRGRA